MSQFDNPAPERRWFALLILGAIIAVSVLPACYPNGPEVVQEFDVVITQFEEGYDFVANSTYAMPDTVWHIKISGDSVQITRQFDDSIITRVARNMQQLGYTRLPTAQAGNADAILWISAVAQKNWVGYVYYPWPVGWCGWPGVVGCGWGPVYPGTGGVAATNFSSGTLYVDWYDPRTFSPTDTTATVRWDGSMNGILDDTRANLEARVLDGIDQMFAQSPYLNRNP